jgi:hypothetical protein
MKSKQVILSLVLLFFLTGCGVNKMLKQGEVRSEDFDSELDFTTVKTVILLPAEIDGNTKNFLFDTGADLSIIQRDSTIGKTSKWSGASNRKMELGIEQVESLRLGDLEFSDTYAGNADMLGLKEQIPNFGGLIGQPIINKANWLIDYPNKKIRISNKDLADDTFKQLDIDRKNGNNPYTVISIDNQDVKALIDFGSSSTFNLPEDSKLAKYLLEKYEFKENERDRYTLGGLQTVKEKVGIIPLIRLGNLEFENVYTTINTSSQVRIGISFFKDYMVYIDNINATYKVLKQ